MKLLRSFLIFFLLLSLLYGKAKNVPQKAYTAYVMTLGLVEAKMIYLLGSFKNYIQEAGDAKEDTEATTDQGSIIFQ